MRVFVDTSALYALLDADDANHRSAAEQWAILVEERHELICTGAILAEATALMQSRLGVEAVQALAGSLQPVLSVLWTGAEEHDRALGAVLAARRRSLPLVDCISFDCMRELGISRAFTFDHHFRERGLHVLQAKWRRLTR